MRIVALAFLFSACTQFTPIKTHGVQRDFISGVNGALIPACIVGSDIDTTDAEDFWLAANGNLLSCDDSQFPIEVNIEEIPAHPKLGMIIGLAKYHTDWYGRIKACEILIDPHWRHQWDLILRHEMGHCFGLADDEDTGFIMDGMIHPQSSELSDHDRELVNEL